MGPGEPPTLPSPTPALHLPARAPQHLPHTFPAHLHGRFRGEDGRWYPGYFTALERRRRPPLSQGGGGAPAPSNGADGSAGAEGPEEAEGWEEVAMVTYAAPTKPYVSELTHRLTHSSHTVHRPSLLVRCTTHSYLPRVCVHGHWLVQECSGGRGERE